MFYGCKSLEELSDISKWNIDNVINMSYMFYGCKSLKELSNISKWNIKDTTDISNIFFGCNFSLNNLSKFIK